MKKHSVGFRLILFASLIVPARSGWAVGSRGLGNQSIGAYPLGQANAVVARAEDASTSFFNPGGLTYFENIKITAGGQILTPVYNRKSFAGSEEDAAKNAFFIPNFFAAGPIGKTGISWGFGFTSPYGLATEWSGTGFSKYVATKSRLTVYHMNPNVAYKFNDVVSLGAGFDYMRVEADLNRQVSVSAVNSSLLLLPPDPTTPDGSFQQEGSGGVWGYNVGLMIRPWEGHRIGFAYRSRMNVTLSGTAKLTGMSGAMAAVFGGTSYSTPGESVIRFPDSTTLGYSFDISKKWTVEGDLEWTSWSVFDEQRVIYPQETNTARLAILNSGNPQARNWKDVGSAAIGTQYRWSDTWTLRGGYLFMDSPVPESTFEPSVPDADLHGIAVGVGYSLKQFSANFAYLANIFPKRDVINTVGAPLSNVNGSYRSFANSFAFNIAYAF